MAKKKAAAPLNFRTLSPEERIDIVELAYDAFEDKEKVAQLKEKTGRAILRPTDISALLEELYESMLVPERKAFDEILRQSLPYCTFVDWAKLRNTLKDIALSCEKEENYIGKRIAQLRKLKHLNQGEFGNLIDSTQTVVSRWEVGDSYPSLPKLLQIANALGVTLNELVQ